MKEITNKSLIKGIFRELSALRKCVYVLIGDKIFPSKIILIDDMSRGDLQNCSIKFQDVSSLGEEVEISFEIDSIHYFCKVEAFPKNSLHFSLPIKIQENQRRKNFRSDLQSLSRQPIVTEIRGLLWRAYGYLKDSDYSRISARVKHVGTNPTIDEIVRLKAYTHQFQVLASFAQIKEIRKIKDDDQIELLMDPYGYKEPNFETRAIRGIVDTLAFLEIFWPDEDGLQLRVEIIDATSCGFSAKIVGVQKEYPPKGAFCRINGEEMVAQLQWQVDDKMGFDLSCNNREILSLWGSWVDEWQLRVLNRTPKARQQKKIASALIRSGYLKDQKATAFAATPDLFNLIPNNSNTRSWLKRFLRGSETELDAHLSFARCSDTSWMIQELGNSAINFRFGEKILTESIESFYFQERSFLTVGSTLVAIFDPESKFNISFWGSRIETPGLDHYETRLINLGKALNDLSLYKDSHEHEKFSIVSPSVENWTKLWSELKCWISERTLLGFGLRADDFLNPELRQALAQGGYHIERSIQVIYFNQTQIGLVVSMGVPTFSNLNNTSSHLFIILKDINQWKDVLKILFCSKNESTKYLGLLEAVIFSPRFDNQEIESSGFIASHASRRKIFFIPIHNLPVFLKLGGKIE